MIIAGSSLRLNISIGEDIGATGTAVFGYVNKNTSGTLAATVSDTLTGTAYRNLTPVDMSITGIWTVWATFTLGDGRVLKTPARQFTVYAEGTVQR